MKLNDFHKYIYQLSKHPTDEMNVFDITKYSYLFQELSYIDYIRIYTTVLLQHLRDILKMDFNDDSQLFLYEYINFNEHTTIEQLIRYFSPSNKAYECNINKLKFSHRQSIKHLQRNVKINELNNGKYIFSNLDVYGINLN